MTVSNRNEASILHIDMDSFFVSVELLDKQHLRGRAVAVAHDGLRSVITSASYEARRFGVRSAMPTVRAKNLCPDLVLIPPNIALYREVSQKIMAFLKNVTPLVEQLSIDEAFLDVSGVQKSLGTPTQIAALIRNNLKRDFGLPASVGIARNKFVAKLASDKAKPDGVFVVEPYNTIKFLHALPVTDLWGVGPATARTLKSYAIHTVADLAAEPFDSLRRILGEANAKKLQQLSRGEDNREVETETQEKSIGHEETFAVDIFDPKAIDRQLLELSWRTALKLRDKNLEAKTVAIKIRWNTFETVNRSKTLTEATSSAEKIYQTSKQLLDSIPTQKPIRLLGVRAEQLLEAGSGALTLWSEEEDTKKVDSTVDELRQKFGAHVIKPATLLKD